MYMCLGVGYMSAYVNEMFVLCKQGCLCGYMYERLYAHLQNKYYLLAGENRQLKQANERSENEIIKLGAQVHSLEMDSLDKDTHIEKYQAMMKEQEGECTCKILS